MRKAYTMIALLVALVALALMATDLYVPALPYMTESLHTSAAVAKLTITFYMLGLSISPLLFGPLADRYGRRPVMLWCVAIGLLGSVLAWLAPSIQGLIAARLVQSIGLGGAISLTRVVASDLFEGEHLAKVAGIVSLIVVAGPAVAPVIGGYLQSYFGWRSVFAVVSLGVAVVGYLLYAKLDETAASLNINALKWHTMRRNYGMILANPVFVGTMAACSLSIAAMIVYASLSPYILRTVYHLSAVQFGWMTGAISAVMVVSRYVNLLLLKRFSVNQVLYIGIFGMNLGAMSLLGFDLIGWHHVAFIVLPAMVMVLGTGVVPSNAMVIAIAPFRHMAGSFSALYGSMVMFGGFLTSFVASQLPNSMAMLGGLLVAMSLTALLGLQYARRAQAGTAEVVA